MYIILFSLIICCAAFAIAFARPTPDGRAWSKWDTKRKMDYVARTVSALKRKGSTIKNPPAYYIKELGIFYVKDDANLVYNIAHVLENLIRIHEQA